MLVPGRQAVVDYKDRARHRSSVAREKKACPTIGLAGKASRPLYEKDVVVL
jgi:hypothetical protein